MYRGSYLYTSQYLSSMDGRFFIIMFFTHQMNHHSPHSPWKHHSAQPEQYTPHLRGTHVISVSHWNIKVKLTTQETTWYGNPVPGFSMGLFYPRDSPPVEFTRHSYQLHQSHMGRIKLKIILSSPSNCLGHKKGKTYIFV